MHPKWQYSSNQSSWPLGQVRLLALDSFFGIRNDRAGSSGNARQAERKSGSSLEKEAVDG
jgi:hypothetical protein